MLSSSPVLDHQLIFHIMYGLRQFHHRQNKGEERRGKIWQKKHAVPKRKERGELLGFLLQKKTKNEWGTGSVRALIVPKRKQALWG